MLRCGYCDLNCDSYEGWLYHLVSDQHQANLGVHDIFTKHARDDERSSRSLIITKMNSKTPPYEVLCDFAKREPLAFITDAYVHIFPHVSEKFYLIVFDQRKFVTQIIEIHRQLGHIASSQVCFESKSSIEESNWKRKIQSSFFYRRHENLKRKLIGLGWNQQLSKMLQVTSLDAAGYTHREQMIEELESLVHESEDFKDAMLHPFGSCITYLADVNADLDVYMDVTGKKDSSRQSRVMTRDEKLNIMKKVRKMLSKKYDGENVHSITSARVPIIKLSHHSGLKVDISFENGLSVRNSKLILLMSRFDYRTHPLLMFLRYWARYHNLVGPHAVKNYALILMVLVNLRQQRIIPSVHEMQTVEGLKPNMISNWNTAFCGSRTLAHNCYPWLKCRVSASSGELAQPVMKLAYEFFKEYAALDYETQVICPYLGGYLPRALFESADGGNLPREMDLYKVNLAAGNCSPFATQKLFCVQDPFALNINVTASCVSQDIYNGWKNACAAAAEALKPYIAVYDSCGTVGIFDLVCVHQPKIPEISVKEALTNCIGNSDNVLEDRHQAKSRHRPSRYDRDGKGSPIRIKRVSVYDNDDPEPLISPRFIKTEPISSDEHKNEDELPVNNTLQTVSFVPESKPEEIKEPPKDKVAKDKPREKNKKDKSTKEKLKQDKSGKKRKAKDSRPGSPESETSSTSSKKTKTSKSKSSSRRSSDASSASLSEIVVRLQNGVKEERQVLYNGNGVNEMDEDHQMSSPPKVAEPPKKMSPPTSDKAKSPEAPISVPSPTVKFVPSPEMTKPEEQTVRFILNETDPPPVVIKVEKEECNNNDETELEDGFNHIMKNHNFISYSRENSYGCYGGNNYINFDQPLLSKPKPVEKSKAVEKSLYVPPQLRAAVKLYTDQLPPVSNPTPPPGLPLQQLPLLNGHSIKIQDGGKPPKMEDIPSYNFPSFALCLTDEFTNQYYTQLQPILSDLGNYSSVNMKMNVCWTNFVSDFFAPVNFWEKIKVILETFEAVKINNEDHAYIFYQVDRNGHMLEGNNSFLQENGKINGCESKVLVVPTNSAQEVRDNLLTKLSKIPANVRKKFANVYSFSVHPNLIFTLHNQWIKLSSQLTESQAPLDVFGKLCPRIRGFVSNHAAKPTVTVNLIVAFDTSASTPGIYFGFQTQDEAQNQVQLIFESIIKDLLPAYVKHRLLNMGRWQPDQFEFNDAMDTD